MEPYMSEFTVRKFSRNLKKKNGFGTERNGFQVFYFISISLLVCWQC